MELSNGYVRKKLQNLNNQAKPVTKCKFKFKRGNFMYEKVTNITNGAKFYN